MKPSTTTLSKRQRGALPHLAVLPLLGFLFISNLVVLALDSENQGEQSREELKEICTDPQSPIPAEDAPASRTSTVTCNGGDGKHWKWDPKHNNHTCNIERITMDQLFHRFGRHGLPPNFPHPVVITGAGPERNEKFTELCHPERIATSTFPLDFKITLSSSNTFSSRRRTIPLQQYLHEISFGAGETLPYQLANETWYFFGESYSDEWTANLLQFYEKPPCQACAMDELVALAFGIGNAGSGVSWHVHGPGFSEAIIGRKHWVLYPPSSKSSETPQFVSPNETSRFWMEHRYTALLAAQLKGKRSMKLPWECTLQPGDILYFPDQWYHATINMDKYTAFVSTFVQEHLFLQ